MLENLSVEGVTTYVEKRLGPRAATVAGDVMVIATLMAAMAFILGAPFALYGGLKWLGQEFGLSFPKFAALPDFRVGDWSLFVIAIGLTVWMSNRLLRRITAQDRQRQIIADYISTRLDPRIKALGERLEFLEQNVPDIEDVRKNYDYFMASFDEVKKRTAALENHIDIDGSTKRLTDLMVAHEMLRAGAPIVIESARYGIGISAAKSVDVTEKVRGYVKNGQIDILVNNDTMGVHPFAGEKKTLFVTYSVNGAFPKDVAADETTKLVIPENTGMTLRDLSRFK